MGYEDLEEGFQVVLADGLDVGDEQVEEEGSEGGDGYLAQEHDDVADAPHDGVAQRVGPH